MHELFILLGGVYSPSVNHVANWKGVQPVRELFIHFGGVYNPSVNYLATWEGCTIPP